jgi:hypothetical protein
MASLDKLQQQLDDQRRILMAQQDSRPYRPSYGAHGRGGRGFPYPSRGGHGRAGPIRYADRPFPGPRDEPHPGHPPAQHGPPPAPQRVSPPPAARSTAPLGHAPPAAATPAVRATAAPAPAAPAKPAKKVKAQPADGATPPAAKRARPGPQDRPEPAEATAALAVEWQHAAQDLIQTVLAYQQHFVALQRLVHVLMGHVARYNLPMEWDPSEPTLQCAARMVERPLGAYHTQATMLREVLGRYHRLRAAQPPPSTDARAFAVPPALGSAAVHIDFTGVGFDQQAARDRYDAVRKSVRRALGNDWPLSASETHPIPPPDADPMAVDAAATDTQQPTSNPGSSADDAGLNSPD